MQQQGRKFLFRRDILVAAVILAAAVAFYSVSGLAAAKGGAAAEIYSGTKLVKTIALKPGLSETFAVPGQPNVILRVSDGKICFYSSTCRDKICINSGWLSRPGESAACLPNRVAVKIVAAGGGASDGPDTFIK